MANEQNEFNLRLAVERSRIDQLENEVRALKIATATRTTPVFGVAGFIAFVVFGLLVAKAPLPDNVHEGARWPIGLAVGFAGYVIAGFAVLFVKFALRALVEIAVVVFFFLNAVAAIVVGLSSTYLSNLVATWKVAEGHDTLTVALILSSLTMFVIDALLMLILYPVSRAAGSDVLGD